jgi:YVTN family beta-propeller protein
VARTGRLIVLNKDEDSLSFIDCRDGRTLAKLPLDANPHEVAVSPDGGRSYVTNAGGNTLSIVDNERMAELDRITHPEFRFPHGLALTPDGRHLWLAATRSDRVFVFNTANMQPETVLATGQSRTHMVSPNADWTRVYIPNIGSATVTAIDVAGRRIIKHIAVGNGPEGVAAHPDGHHLYVANQHDNNLYIMDETHHGLVARLALGTLPIRIAFTPDGRYALLPNRESGDLSVVDTGRRWEIKRPRTGVWPGGVVTDPSGSFAYVANNKTNDVSVIDLDRLVEVERFEAGIHPDGMGYVPA